MKNLAHTRRLLLGVILSGTLLGGIFSPATHDREGMWAGGNTAGAPGEKVLRGIGVFQASALGREFYVFAQRSGARIESNSWGSIYTRKGEVIEINTNLSGLAVPVALAHELRHHWQFETIGPARNLSPAQALRLSQLQEGDACAFAAHYADNYEKETGQRLNAAEVHPHIAHYLSPAPENNRDYVEGAFVPCLAISYGGKGYTEIHLVREGFRMKDLTRAFNAAIDAGDSAEMRRLYDAEFTNPDTSSALALYRKFFTQDSDPLHTIPAVRAMDDGEFGRLLDRIAPLPASPELAELEISYRTMKRQLEDRLGVKKPGA
ncbi:MAG: DUF6782 family putative metallopeptidase [Alphaproteobacteria bacterium]